MRVHAGEANIVVAVRIRPISRKEIQLGEQNILKGVHSNIVVLRDPNDLNDSYASGNQILNLSHFQNGPKKSALTGLSPPRALKSAHRAVS
mgnify:CR=1 FL=1